MTQKWTDSGLASIPPTWRDFGGCVVFLHRHSGCIRRMQKEVAVKAGLPRRDSDFFVISDLSPFHHVATGWRKANWGKATLQQNRLSQTSSSRHPGTMQTPYSWSRASESRISSTDWWLVTHEPFPGGGCHRSSVMLSMLSI